MSENSDQLDLPVLKSVVGGGGKAEPVQANRAIDSVYGGDRPGIDAPKEFRLEGTWPLSHWA